MTAERTTRGGVVSPELQLYLDRILATERIDPQQERELMDRWFDQGDRGAADRIIETHMRFVVAIALKYRNYPISMSDMISEGTMGLMVAFSRFDRSRNTRFVTYASFWIRAHILDLVIRSWHSGKLGTGPFKSKIFFKLRREHSQLASRFGDSPRANEILARRMGLDAEKVGKMLRQIEAGEVSLDMEISPSSNVTRKDLVADEEPDPYQQVCARQEERMLAIQVQEALRTLDRRERFVVENRLMGETTETLASLGEALGVSRERARQIEVRARRKLREHLTRAA